MAEVMLAQHYLLFPWLAIPDSSSLLHDFFFPVQRAIPHHPARRAQAATALATLGERGGTGAAAAASGARLQLPAAHPFSSPSAARAVGQS